MQVTTIWRMLLQLSRFRLFIIVPYAVLAALTFPAIFTATGNVVTSTAGTLVALILAYFDTGLVIVAVGAVAGALLAGIFL